MPKPEILRIFFSFFTRSERLRRGERESNRQRSIVHCPAQPRHSKSTLAQRENLRRRTCPHRHWPLPRRCRHGQYLHSQNVNLYPRKKKRGIVVKGNVTFAKAFCFYTGQIDVPSCTTVARFSTAFCTDTNLTYFLLACTFWSSTSLLSSIWNDSVFTTSNSVSDSQQRRNQ